MLTKNLIKELNNTLSQENVLSEIEERYVYSVDASNPSIKTNLPDAVVFVESIEQVQKVVQIANKHNTQTYFILKKVFHYSHK